MHRVPPRSAPRDVGTILQERIVRRHREVVYRIDGLHELLLREEAYRVDARAHRVDARRVALRATVQVDTHHARCRELLLDSCTRPLLLNEMERRTNFTNFRQQSPIAVYGNSTTLAFDQLQLAAPIKSSCIKPDIVTFY